MTKVKLKVDSDYGIEGSLTDFENLLRNLSFFGLNEGERAHLVILSLGNEKIHL